jgi:hypothetical protein
MQENDGTKIAKLTRRALAFLASYMLLMAAFGFLSLNDGRENAPCLPMRNLEETVQELPDHRFEVRVRFQYQVDGEWLSKDNTYPVANFGYAKKIELDSRKRYDGVRFATDSTDSFLFVSPEASDEGEGERRLIFPVTLLIMTWLIFAMRKLSPGAVLVVFMFLVSLFLGWGMSAILADQVESAQKLGSWTKVDAHLDFYEMKSLHSVNTRYRYSFQGKDYTGGWVALEPRLQTFLPPHTVAWALLSGNNIVTCYVNPANPQQSCLTKFNSLSTLFAGTFLLMAILIQWLLYRVLLRKGEPVNSVAAGKHWATFFKVIGGLSGLLLVTWMPSLLVFSQTSSTGSLLMVFGPLAVIATLLSLIGYRIRKR